MIVEDLEVVLVCDQVLIPSCYKCSAVTGDLRGKISAF
eukprot:COSAG01_NODE_741_length_13888_cov_119.430996_11_plen_38_part_00